MLYPLGDPTERNQRSVAMSLRPQRPEPVPDGTVRVARAAFPTGNRYLQMRDTLDVIDADADFLHLFPGHGKPAYAPWRLALATIFPFAAHLPDRQAADAVRGRIDGKDARSRDRTDPGFDHTVLSEFRSRLVDGGAASLRFDLLLTQFRQRGLLKARGRQRTDSTHVLAAIRALNVLAVVAPDWLRAQSQPEWVERYVHRSEDDRLPTTRDARRVFAETIGVDGLTLLTAIDAVDAPIWLRVIPAIETLRRVWGQNDLAGGAARRDAAIALYRACQDRSGTSPDCGGAQLRAGRELVRGHHACADATIALRGLDGRMIPPDFATSIRGGGETEEFADMEHEADGMTAPRKI
jgi:transposase